MNIEPTLAQVAQFLVSFWKPLLILLPFIPWAWLISSVLDKDAKYHYLNARMWNGIHLATGAAALATMIFIPIFFVGFPVGLLVLSSSLVVYWQVRDRQVPEDAQFSLSSFRLSEKLEARRAAKASRHAVLRFIDAKDKERPVPQEDNPLRPVHLAAEDIIVPSIEARATRIDLVLTAKGTVVYHTIDGVRSKRQPLPADVGAKIFDYIKDIAGMDTSDRRREQVGVCEVVAPTGRVKTNVTTAGSSAAQQLRLEFNRQERLIKPFDALGLLPSQLQSLRELEVPENRHGIVLLGAPQGHGLSTLGYSFLNRHDAYTSNIKTLEAEVEAELDGVDHAKWDPSSTTADFATSLQSILRRDPDIVLIAQPRDSESAVVASQPGIEGPLIYVPQRASSIEEQVADWVKRVGDVKQATRALRAVVNGRLVRTLCPNCRQAYQPAAEQLKKLNLSPDRVKQLYRKGGKVQVKNRIEECPVCQGSGYLNQTGIFEVMMVDDDVRRLLMAGDLKGARAHARRNKMIYLHEAAMQKVLTGETSLEELVRVTSATNPAAGRSESKTAGAAAPA